MTRCVSASGTASSRARRCDREGSRGEPCRVMLERTITANAAHDITPCAASRCAVTTRINRAHVDRTVRAMPNTPKRARYANIAHTVEPCNASRCAVESRIDRAHVDRMERAMPNTPKCAITANIAHAVASCATSRCSVASRIYRAHVTSASVRNAEHSEAHTSGIANIPPLRAAHAAPAPPLKAARMPR